MLRVMNRMRVVTFAKLPWIFTVSTNEIAHCYGMTRSPTLVAPFFALPPPSVRTFYQTRTNSVLAAEETNPGFFTRIFRKIKPDLGKHKRLQLGHILFEDVTDNFPFNDFFMDFKMPDTFYSWFVVMELHVWMLMVRYMAEGKHGQEMRNAIVEAMWNDLNTRKGKLENANLIALKKQVNELSQQFNAAMIGYDEGLLSDDKVLAGALWRRLFQSECNNPEYLEQLVIYVRKQMNEFDRLSRDELFTMRTVKWIDYRMQKPTN